MVFQLEEIFTLQLQTYKNLTASIGSRSSIIVKVKENDKPYGVIQFRDTSLLTYISKFCILYIKENKSLYLFLNVFCFIVIKILSASFL